MVAGSTEFDDIDLNYCTPVERWSTIRDCLYKVLDDLVEVLDRPNSDLVHLKNDCAIVCKNLESLGNLASTETQREISTTLNADDDDEIVIDLDENQSNADVIYAEEADLVKELRKLPGIGDKLSLKISEYIFETGDENAYVMAQMLNYVNNEVESMQTSISVLENKESALFCDSELR